MWNTRLTYLINISSVLRMETISALLLTEAPIIGIIESDSFLLGQHLAPSGLRPAVASTGPHRPWATEGVF